MHKCSNCGREFDGKFCPDCGEKYVDKDVCPNCGAHHAPDAKFCVVCGARLDGKIACPNCGAIADAGASFCGECGALLTAAKPKKANSSVAEKVTFYVYLSGIICILLSALMGLVFTFVCGVSMQSDGKTVQTSMLYDYFGEHYKDLGTIRETVLQNFKWRSMGGAREFALYFPVVLGTVISAVGILGVVALTALTVFKAYKKFYKKAEANVIAPAVATYLCFAMLATLLMALSATDASGIKTVFSAPTLAGLITGGVLCGLGLLLVAAANYKSFKGFGAAVGSIASVAVSVFTVVIIAVMALPSLSIGVNNVNIQDEMSEGLFTGLQSMLLMTEDNETMYKLIAFACVGGIAAIALTVISAVTLSRKIPAVCNAKNKSNIILCAVNLALAAVFLAFVILFGDEQFGVYTELFGGIKYEADYAVPITVLVMAFLALAAELAGKLIR